MLRFVAFEKRDKDLEEKLNYYKNLVDQIQVQYTDNPEKFRQSCVNTIEAIQNIKVNIENPDIIDDELPDYDKLSQLRTFMKNREQRSDRS